MPTFHNSRGEAYDIIVPPELLQRPTISILDATLTPDSTTLLDGHGSQKDANAPTVWLVFDTKTGRRIGIETRIDPLFIIDNSLTP